MFRKLCLVLLVALAACPAARAQLAGTGNRANSPFATISDGLLGPMVVDVPPGAPPAIVNDAVAKAWRRGKPVGRTGDATYSFLARHRLIRPGSTLSFQRPVVLRENGRLRLPDLERTARTRRRLGGGEITFAYDGWSDTDQAAVSAFVALMYPVAKSIYGAPSATITVHIVRDDTLRDSTMHLRNGIYNASTNEIRINPTGGAFQDDMYSLTHLILYAFHDDALFAYDSWEEGFSWAATYVVFKHIYPDFDLGDSFKTFYFLQLYELLNQPGIGNARFWPASFDQIVANDYSSVFPFTMFVFRSAMAGAAWTKVYIENNSFFHDFNEAYYARFTPDLAGHTPALKALAAGIVPTVEGLGFEEWYRLQNILDTSTRDGRQFWVYALPQFDRDDGAGTNMALLLYHLQRDAAGNETPLGGTCKLTYFSWDYIQDYFAEEGNEADIPAAGNTVGVGAISPGVFNVGGAQKINVQASVNGLTRTIRWPYLVRGKEAAANDLFGVTLESETGEFGVIVGSGIEQRTPLAQSAFGMKAGMNGWNKLAIRITDSEGKTATRQVNAGYDFYVAVAQGPRPAPAAFQHTFPAGACLMSVPAYPVKSDADALGIPANRLRLAHWDPTYNSGTDGYRYRIYPGTPPLAPGIGYWLTLDQDTTIQFDGNPLPQDQAFYIPLRTGWNQIGHPFLQSVAVSSLSVSTDLTNPDQTLDLSAAANQNLVSGTVWGYSPADGYVPADNLDPWGGYWVFSQADLMLKVPAVAQPAQSVAPGAILPGDPIIGDTRSRSRRSALAAGRTRSTPSNGWQCRLVARAGNMAGSLIVGTSRAATDGFDAAQDAQRPPDMGSYVRLSVQHPDWGRAAGDYAVDIRSSAAPTQTWDITLDTNLRNQDVQLCWPSLAQLPNDVRLFLTDLDGGQRRYLRSSPSLTINSGDTGRRRLRLEARHGAAGMLAIGSIVVTPTRAAGGMDVQFSLSADAMVSAQVASPSGRKLRDLAQTRAMTAGVNHLPWDGRSDPGVSLGPGIYLLQLTATTEEGQTVHAVRPVVLVR